MARKLTIVKCKECGEQFKTTLFLQIFCCRLCSQRWHQKRWRKNKPNYYKQMWHANKTKRKMNGGAVD